MKAPLTEYLCDLIDLQAGKIDKEEMRRRWTAGKYRGVKSDYAAWAMGMVR